MSGESSPHHVSLYSPYVLEFLSTIMEVWMYSPGLPFLPLNGILGGTQQPLDYINDPVPGLVLLVMLFK